MMLSQACRRAAVFTALATLAVTVGCTQPPTAEGEPEVDQVCAATADPCRKTTDCPGGSICDKAGDGDAIPEASDDFGCCLKVLCDGDADCGDEERCDIRRGICVPKNLCDPGDSAAVCGADKLCVYTDGAPRCQSAADLPAADGCSIAPGSLFVTAGKDLEVKVVGTRGDQLVPFAKFNFISDLPAIDPTTGVLNAACAGSSICTGTVTARLTSNEAVSCTAAVNVYPAVAAGDFRAVLFDSRTNGPLANADIVVRANGALLTTKKTDANGIALFSGVSVADVEAISAFPEGYQWNTVLAPTSNDLALVAAPLRNTAKVAGVKGKFDFGAAHTRGEIEVGIAGTAISSAITDFSFGSLLGEIAKHKIEIAALGADEQEVPLPSGLSLSLAGTPVKDGFVTFAEPGKRVVWAVGGKLRIAEIGPIISTVTGATKDGGSIDIGGLLGTVVPFFAKFDHATVTGMNLTEIDRPAPPGEDLPVPYEQWNFPELAGANAVRLDTLVSQSASFTMPSLPCSPGAGVAPACNGSFSSGAIAITGVVVPGQGIVPLGLAAALDDASAADGDQFDGIVEAAKNTPDAPPKGTLRIDYAPPHDGLEGNLFVTVAIAVDLKNIKNINSIDASLLTNVNTKLGPANTFKNTFLEHQGGTFTPGAAGQFTIVPKGSADFYRVVFDDGAGREWNVWTENQDASFKFDDLGVPDATRLANADVQAFRLGNGYGDIDTSKKVAASFEDLMSFNGTNLDNLLFYMGAWSNQTCREDDGALCKKQVQAP